MQERRGFILGTVAALAAVVIGISAFLLIRDALEKKAAFNLENLITHYKELKPSFDAAGSTDTTDTAATTNAADDTVAGATDAEDTAAAASAADDKKAQVEKLLEDLLAFAGKSSGYMPASAYSMAGSIYAARKDWAAAEEAYLNSAKKAGKTFLAPVSYFNAAVCAEEAGKTDDARAYWTKSLSYADFPLAARAQFSLSRTFDAEGKTDEALAAYRLLIEKYEKEEEWTKLAHSRIITLEQKGE